MSGNMSVLQSHRLKVHYNAKNIGSSTGLVRAMVEFWNLEGMNTKVLATSPARRQCHHHFLFLKIKPKTNSCLASHTALLVKQTKTAH